MPSNRLSSLKPKERMIAGFILHKLWIDRYWCGKAEGSIWDTPQFEICQKVFLEARQERFWMSQKNSID
jgi:hypothetical protein